jgi:N-glycosylase/DNA lyase
MTQLSITLRELTEATKVLENFAKPKTDEEIFYNLCFCLLVPQTSFKRTFQVVQGLKEMNFYDTFHQDCGDYMIRLAAVISPCRFYKVKSERLRAAKQDFDRILTICKLDSFSTIQKRQWLVKHVKGLDMKAASHFLRNLGARDLAIIDTHIIKWLGLEENRIETRRTSISRNQISEAISLFGNAEYTRDKVIFPDIKNKEGFKKWAKEKGIWAKAKKWDYLKVENRLKKLAKRRGFDVATLDAMIWKKYSGTDWRNFVY